MENVDRDKSSSTAFLEKVDSTLVAWLIFLVFGGSIISLYYARIHYLPDIEWSSSIVHLAVATFVGGAITLLLALSLLIPGYIWSEFLIYDERFEHAFCIQPTSKDLCLRTLLTYIGLPFWLVLLTSHVVLIFFSYVVKAESQPDIEDNEKDQRVFKYVAWFGLSIVLGQISMILIYLLSRRLGLEDINSIPTRQRAQ